MSVVFQDLYDIEARPGAGIARCTAAVELQLERVREVNYRHRLHVTPNTDEQRNDATAEQQLHADVYFLALSIRRLLRFQDALDRTVSDGRLTEAREAFDAAAPDATLLRDVYEHLDEYVLDRDRKHHKLPGRVAPVLELRWDCDNVVVALGDRRIDITLAAVAAIEMGKASHAVWLEHLETAKSERYPAAPPDSSEGEATLEISMGTTTRVSGGEADPVIATGILLDVHVREPMSAETGER